MSGSGSSEGRALGRRLAEALLLLVPISSALAGVVTLIYALTPLVVYEGWTLSGSVGLLGSELRAFGEPVRAPPLESVPRISSFLLALGVSSLALAAFSLGLRTLGRDLAYLEVASASAVASALALTLLYSLLRVLVTDILPLLEATSSAYTTAGRLYFDPPAEKLSPALEAYIYYGRLLLIWGAVSVFATLVPSYRRLRAGDFTTSSPHHESAEEGVDDA